MKELRGSEKQIAWAEKIMSKFEKELDAAKEEAKKEYCSIGNPNFCKFKIDLGNDFEAIWDKYVNFGRGIDDASLIIDQRHYFEKPFLGFGILAITIDAINDGASIATAPKWAVKIAKGE